MSDNMRNVFDEIYDKIVTELVSGRINRNLNIYFSKKLYDEIVDFDNRQHPKSGVSTCDVKNKKSGIIFGIPFYVIDEKDHSEIVIGNRHDN